MEPGSPARSPRIRTAVLVVALVLGLAACSTTTDSGKDEARPPGVADTGGPRVPAGSCDGLKNGVGITDSDITIANASDIGGFVPGLFKEVQLAVQAYVAYFNKAQSICGRKLKLLPLDSRIDAGADKQAAVKACDQAFATVGSMAVFDSGGAAEVAKCGIPELRTTMLTPERQQSKVTYATDSLDINFQPKVVPDYFAKKYPEAVKSAAFLYLNAGSAAANAKPQIAAWKASGFNFVYTQPVDPFETNYTAFVLQLKKKNVKYVQFLGNYQNSVRLATAMAAQSYKPELYVLDASGYDRKYIREGGPATEGTRVFINSALFEEADKNEEMQRYVGWLQEVDPSARPTYFGLFAWSSARLFTELATKLGGKLTRETLLTALAGVKEWDGHGLFSPQAVGAKRSSGCAAIIKLEKKVWVRESKGEYLCGPLTNVTNRS